MNKQKKFPPVKLTIEKDGKTKRIKIKHKGLGGIRFAARLGKYVKAGYNLIDCEGHPEDPIYQYCRAQINGGPSPGALTVASQVTGANISAIKDKAKQMMEKFKK